jgi:conjugal transfer pilus assembly protein TraE
MKWGIFKNHWDSTKRANFYLLGAVAMLSVSNVMLGARLATLHERVVLTPPRFTKQLEVGYNSANREFYKAWALYAAELVGNLTPANAAFVANGIGKLVSPKVYPSIKNAILIERAQEVQYHVVTSFEARQAIWQPATSTVFVTGWQHQITPSGTYTASNVETYQINIHIVEGQPVITGFQLYSGIPHTLPWMQNHAKQMATPIAKHPDGAQ